jgi:hypothetical protein
MRLNQDYFDTIINATKKLLHITWGEYHSYFR